MCCIVFYSIVGYYYVLGSINMYCGVVFSRKILKYLKIN